MAMCLPLPGGDQLHHLGIQRGADPGAQPRELVPQREGREHCHAHQGPGGVGAGLQSFGVAHQGQPGAPPRLQHAHAQYEGGNARGTATGRCYELNK